MKIFLTAINAKYIHSNLAVYSLRAYAKDYQDQIVIGEYTINNRVDYILEQIYKAKPDVLCFSCYIWNMDYVEELITEYHKLCPEVPIWVGGPEVSYEVETFFAEHPQVTGVMIGEGERTFQQLCKYYVNQTGSLEEIRGIAFLGSGQWEDCFHTGTGTDGYVQKSHFATITLKTLKIVLFTMNQAVAVRSTAVTVCHP